MKALIIGGTGATGKNLVQELILHPQYEKVVVFVRRLVGIDHPKVEEVLTDFDQLETIDHYINGEVLFSCLGTTLKDAGSKGRQRHIDHDIPLAFAERAQRNGVSRIVLLSAYGADPGSLIFYSRLKGELEVAIDRLGFSQYTIFRPGSLIRKNTDRTGERVMNTVFTFLNKFGLLKRFHPLKTEILAEKMAKAPGKLPEGKHIISLEEVAEF